MDGERNGNALLELAFYRTSHDFAGGNYTRRPTFDTACHLCYEINDKTRVSAWMRTDLVRALRERQPPPGLIPSFR